MQGEGIGLDGQLYHIDSLGDGGWVTASGRSDRRLQGLARRRAVLARRRLLAQPHRRRHVPARPLAAGPTASGATYVPLRGVSFAPGPSLPLRYYQSIAVDPSVIPLGSRVYIPAYRNDGHGGWFVAQDTGGAIVGHRIDVYRQPPASSSRRRPVPHAAAGPGDQALALIRPRSVPAGALD